MDNNHVIQYEPPMTEVTKVRTEGIVCASYGGKGKAGTIGPGNVYSFDDDE